MDLIKKTELRMNETILDQEAEPLGDPRINDLLNPPTSTSDFNPQNNTPQSTDNMPVHDSSSLNIRTSPESIPPKTNTNKFQNSSQPSSHNRDIFEHSPLEDSSVELKRLEDILLEIRNLRIQNQYIIEHLRKLEQKLDRY